MHVIIIENKIELPKDNDTIDVTFFCESIFMRQKEIRYNFQTLQTDSKWHNTSSNDSAVGKGESTFCGQQNPTPFGYSVKEKMQPATASSLTFFIIIKLNNYNNTCSDQHRRYK